jgi:cytochrome c-type biogenesis protein CcmH/NrfG
LVNTGPARGLPPRIALPIVAVFSLIFLGIMAYLVGQGFGVTGSVFGKAAKPGTVAGVQRQQPQGSQNNVEGGPPPAVAEQLKTLRERIAKHPDDDVAITQLGDMYLAANRYAEAVPLYRQALKVNPRNVAAQTGLAQAQEALREMQSQQ